MIDKEAQPDTSIASMKPLMIEGSFQLRGWPMHSAWNSIITHDCERHGGNWIAPVDGEVKQCLECDEIVPDSIIGAWTLHNFDAIQRYERS